MTTTLYDTDVYAWSQRQAALLRAEDFEHVDWNNLIEEIDSVGIEQLHKVESHLIRLLQHLLKWQYQPSKRATGRSWQLTIVEQRDRLQRVLHKNPSLSARLPEILAEVYPSAVKFAAVETGLDKRTFPAECPWSAEQVLDEEFWPEA
ncbi:MAG: DUF29 domain-containing protein [Caldilineaceae bacterium]|nr:DUF29 domain-containing protein [Caldilineaceae bacterium]